MIDLKRLSQLDGGGCLIPRDGAEAPSCHEFTVGICDCERIELVRLARLGLWAEDQGIPMLEYFAETVFYRGLIMRRRSLGSDCI